jgi:hypothetical protein
MGSLERILPKDLTGNPLKLGNEGFGSSRTELVLPHAEALRAIAIATERDIAILGLEAFEVQQEGLLTVDLADASAYIHFAGDWERYVAAMNAEAELWIRGHRLGENHGYILTSASRDEFACLNKNRASGPDDK